MSEWRVDSDGGGEVGSVGSLSAEEWGMRSSSSEERVAENGTGPLYTFTVASGDDARYEEAEEGRGAVLC